MDKHPFRNTEVLHFSQNVTSGDLDDEYFVYETIYRSKIVADVQGSSNGYAVRTLRCVFDNPLEPFMASLGKEVDVSSGNTVFKLRPSQAWGSETGSADHDDTKMGVCFRPCMKGWILVPDIERPSWHIITDVTDTTLTVEGDIKSLSLVDKRFRIYAPPNTDALTGWDNNQRYVDEPNFLWKGYRYQRTPQGAIDSSLNSGNGGVVLDPAPINKLGSYYLIPRTEHQPRRG